MTRYTGNLALLAVVSGCINACSDSGSGVGMGTAMTPPMSNSSVPSGAPGGSAGAMGGSAQQTPTMPPATPTNGQAVPMGGGAAAVPAMPGDGVDGMSAGAAGGDGAAPAAGELLEGACPGDYKVMPGLNRDFPSAGLMRAFYVVPPSDTTTPMPVWVPLTGTQESTQQNMEVLRSGNNQAVAEYGYMVLGPVRICANQDPMVTSANCSGNGPPPYMYIPWRDGAAMNVANTEPVYKEEGPDSVFFEEMVRCVAASYPILKNKLYLGGISAGGSMAHRALTFNSDFWAGGVPISGEWRTSTEDGRAISGTQAESQMQAEPMGIFPGRTPPWPLPELDSMVVVTIRGGDNDTWPGTAYKPDAQASSNFYASQAKVVSVVCMGNWGHQWPKDMSNPEWTNEFNRWVVDLMASHPKGTPPSEFKLTDPPEGAGFSCMLGRFDQLYGS
jgi:poly(3-hydroxybutyrate) depolymerase